MKKYVCFLIASVALGGFFISCKTSSLSVQVLKPAEITIPSKINTLALVNRSLPDDKSRAENIIEGVLSGEGLFVDREASQRTINGLAKTLQNSPRYQVTVPDGLDLRGTGTARFPEPLPWNKVEQICNNYAADALIALETFDSNVSVRFTEEQKQRKEGERTVKYTEHVATMDIAIDAGWRVYYPEEKRIVDQDVYIDHKYWEGRGKKKDEAENNLPDAREAIKETGFFAGSQYAFRISPMWVWVSRKYYTKGTDEMKSARFYVKGKDWEGAKMIWDHHLTFPDKKIAGYAHYNMALYHEIMGDLQAAYNWAQKAYTQYQIKPANQYMNQLNQRINDQGRLQEQME